MTSERDTAIITITRYFTEDGDDLVQFETDDLNGSQPGIVEALCLLELAKRDVCNRPADDD